MMILFFAVQFILKNHMAVVIPILVMCAQHFRDQSLGEVNFCSD